MCCHRGTIGALLASVARRFIPQWVASAMSATNEAVGEVLPDDAEVPVPQDSDDSDDSDDEVQRTSDCASNE